MKNKLYATVHDMLTFYCDENDGFSGRYLIPLHFFISHFKTNVSFDEAYENMIKDSQELISDLLTNAIKEEGEFKEYSEEEIKKIVDEVQKNKEFYSIYEIIKSIYLERDMHGIYKMFYYENLEVEYGK